MPMQDSERNITALYCLRLVAGYHGLELEEKRMAHDNALEDKEPSFRHLGAIASKYGMAHKLVTAAWDKILAMRMVWPVICRKKSGGYIFIAGIREDNPQAPQLVIIDPAPDTDDGAETAGMYRFWNQNAFSDRTDGRALLLKRRYKLTDGSQPFGLLWFLPEFIKLKGLFGQIVVAVIIMTCLSLVMPLFFQIVIDKVLPNETFTTLNVLGFGICAAIIFNGCMEYLRNYLLLFATNKIDINTAMKTFAHLMRLPVNFFERVPSGLLIKHMQQTERIRGFLSGRLFFTILDLLSLTIFIPVLMLYSIFLTLIVLGFTLLMALVVLALVKPFQRRLNTLYEAEGKRQSMLVESLHGIHTVKSLALEPLQEHEWNDASAFAIQSHFGVGKISLTANTLSHVLEMLMNVAVIWVGAHLVFNHIISIGALIAFQMLSNRVSSPLVQLVALIHEYQQTALSVKMLGAVMNSRQEDQGGGVTEGIGGSIEFEHVSFRYREDLPDVLHDLNLHIHKGEIIGIVGKSGSGKSTLARLVQAIYQPQRGIIRINGVDIRELDKAHLRRNMGVVLQDNYFFQGTIRDNIRLANKRATPEEVMLASRMSGADEFVTALPKGYDTILEENASNLSGGQKQRLAIARALLVNPPVLILDEATSALDPESERIVQQNLRSICVNRTVLIITHRLSMVRHANRILVLDKGRIVDLAPHNTLVQKEGLYRYFWKQQMGLTA